VLVFAYDGSLNGDWVAHYAVRFAANTSARELRLVHLSEDRPASHLQERIARITDECRAIGVALQTEHVAGGGADVAARLLGLVPKGATLIAGTRSRPRGSALLAGTVPARLFDAGRFSVIAIRVVHPGVLGQPGRVLLPLTGRPRAAENALPLLRLLGPDLHHLHVLRVRDLPRLGFPMRSDERDERLLAEGRRSVAAIEEALRTSLAPHRFDLDSSVVVSDDTAKEILLQARNHRSRLICLGASERTLSQRVIQGSLVEQVLRAAPSDVAVHRSVV